MVSHARDPAHSGCGELLQRKATAVNGSVRGMSRPKAVSSICEGVKLVGIGVSGPVYPVRRRNCAAREGLEERPCGGAPLTGVDREPPGPFGRPAATKPSTLDERHALPLAAEERMISSAGKPFRRSINVHLLPELVPPCGLLGATAVVVDVLRATTTMIAALAAGCTDVRPCSTVKEAEDVARGLPAGRALRGGERHDVKIAGFDAGNSPLEYTAAVCRGKTLVMTTTNGTRAVLRAAAAERVLVAGFVNFSAVCEQLRDDPRPVHIVCAGTDGAINMEDTLLAGALVNDLCAAGDVRLNDSARLARDCFEREGASVLAAFERGVGARALLAIDEGPDIRFAAEVDRYALVPELRQDPLRVEAGAARAVPVHWLREPPFVGAAAPREEDALLNGTHHHG